jgi:hypothetical protein
VADCAWAEKAAKKNEARSMAVRTRSTIGFMGFGFLGLFG